MPDMQRQMLTVTRPSVMRQRFIESLSKHFCLEFALPFAKGGAFVSMQEWYNQSCVSDHAAVRASVVSLFSSRRVLGTGVIDISRQSRAVTARTPQ